MELTRTFWGQAIYLSIPFALVLVYWWFDQAESRRGRFLFRLRVVAWWAAVLVCVAIATGGKGCSFGTSSDLEDDASCQPSPNGPVCQ